MFKNILVPIHLAYIKNHKKLFKGALEVLDEDGRITLIYVNPNRRHGSVYPLIDDENQINYDDMALTRLKEIAKEHSLPIEKVSFCVKEGSAHQEILEESLKIKADAIVMMAAKPGIGKYFISSTAERVIRHAKCSVFVIRLDNK